MTALAEKIAELLYTADAQPVEWTRASEEDTNYYTRVADVIVDEVIEHIRTGVDIPTDAVCEYLQAEADIARLRRP